MVKYLMQKTFYSCSFGCRVNQAEKESLDQALFDQGFSFKKDKPDLFIINTCAVTQKAEREAKQLIYQAKKRFPNSKLIVTGCAATNWLKMKENILKNADLIVDNLNKEFLVDLIIKKFYQKKPDYNPGAATSSLVGCLPIDTEVYNKYLNSKRSIIKIQDGCNRFCTYCIVPYLRGTPKSIISSTVVAKIKDIENNINEVILTAINTEAYGIDTGETLIVLIKNILEQTKIKRLSFGSINPWSITPEFIQFYKKIAKSPRFVDYFHIPIQSGSNKILKLMKRDYTREELQEKFNSLVKINPFIYFGTDVITGFLDETDQDFQDTYDFLADSPIAKFHVFRFSIRENTSAFYLAKRLKIPSDKVKKARAQALIKLGQKKYHEFQQRHIGQIFRAMFIKKPVQGFQEALLDNQMPILIKSAKKEIGELKQVKVIDLKNNNLVGTIT